MIYRTNNTAIDAFENLAPANQQRVGFIDFINWFQLKFMMSFNWRRSNQK